MGCIWSYAIQYRSKTMLQRISDTQQGVEEQIMLHIERSRDNLDSLTRIIESYMARNNIRKMSTKEKIDFIQSNGVVTISLLENVLKYYKKASVLYGVLVRMERIAVENRASLDTMDDKSFDLLLNTAQDLRLKSERNDERATEMFDATDTADIISTSYYDSTFSLDRMIDDFIGTPQSRDNSAINYPAIPSGSITAGGNRNTQQKTQTAIN